MLDGGTRIPGPAATGVKRLPGCDETPDSATATRLQDFLRAVRDVQPVCPDYPGRRGRRGATCVVADRSDLTPRQSRQVGPRDVRRR